MHREQETGAEVHKKCHNASPTLFQPTSYQYGQDVARTYLSRQVFVAENTRPQAPVKQAAKLLRKYSRVRLLG